MPTQETDDNIRDAVERGTPPLSLEVRERALGEVMVVLRRRSRIWTVVLVVVALLLLAAVGYAAVHWFLPGRRWFR